MPDLYLLDYPFLEKDTVFHVGALDPQAKLDNPGRSSLEAFCLSVSEEPDDWRNIAELGDAPEWGLSRPGSLFVDALALTDPQRREIETWAVERGYGERQEMWRAYQYDPEAEEWRYSNHEDMYAALDEADEDVEPGDGPAKDGTCVEKADGLVLTDEGMNALQCWGDRSFGLDGAIILFSREVLAKLDPGIVGIWWEEDYDPLNLSCPRGGVFPEKVESFKITEYAEEPDAEEDEDFDP